MWSSGCLVGWRGRCRRAGFGRAGVSWLCAPEDRWGGRDERLPQRPAEECKKCDGLDRVWSIDAVEKDWV